MLAGVDCWCSGGREADRLFAAAVALEAGEDLSAAVASSVRTMRGCLVAVTLSFVSWLDTDLRVRVALVLDAVVLDAVVLCLVILVRTPGSTNRSARRSMPSLRALARAANLRTLDTSRLLFLPADGARALPKMDSVRISRRRRLRCSRYLRGDDWLGDYIQVGRLRVWAGAKSIGAMGMLNSAKK